MIQIQKSMREAKQAMLRTFMETTIARVAKAVFAERGYQQATLEEIAQRAGMSKATIYLYYKNKDDLFLHVVEDLVETAITETVQAAEAPETPLEKLARMVRGKMAFYEREREFFHIYLNEKHGLDFNEKHGLEVAPKDPHKRLLQDMYLQGVDRLADVLQEGHGRRGAAAHGGQTARLFPARDDEYSAGAAPPGKSQNFRRGGC